MKQMVQKSDFAIGLGVVALSAGAIAWFLLQDDPCLDKAQAFVATQPAVTARVGEVRSARTSSWLTGQAAARAGERAFYFLVKGARGTANAVVTADKASCTCRLVSLN